MNLAQSHPQVIRSGPRAGQPRPITDTIIDGISAAKEIAVKLKHQGATVIGVDICHGVPRVQIMAGRFTEELKRADVGALWKSRVTRGATEEHGQAAVETNDGQKVHIVWVERE